MIVGNQAGVIKSLPFWSVDLLTSEVMLLLSLVIAESAQMHNCDWLCYVCLCVCVCVPCSLRWFLKCGTLKHPFFLCFFSTVVWTETSSRSSQSFSSSPTPNWDDCEYTFLIFPSFHPELSLSLPLSISSDVLRDPSKCTATALCQNFYRGWGFKSLAVVTQCCSMLLRGGEKECVSASVRPIFKRWKGAWSECFAWTREEFLFRNTSFP